MLFVPVAVDEVEVADDCPALGFAGAFAEVLVVFSGEGFDLVRGRYVFVVVRFGVCFSDVLFDGRGAVAVGLDFLQDDFEQSAQTRVAVFEVLQADASEPGRGCCDVLCAMSQSVSHAEEFFGVVRHGVFLVDFRRDHAVSVAELAVDCSVEQGLFQLFFVCVEEVRV